MLAIVLKFALALLFSALSSIFGLPAFAAEKGKPEMHMFSADDVVFLNELGAIVMPRDKAFVIDMVNPAGQRAKEYQAVDLKKDDEIIMINGKKVTALADLKSAYEAVAVGQDVKLGIRRDKTMMIVSFPKGDTSKMQQQVVMAFDTKGGGDSLAAESWTGGGGKKVMRFDSGGGNIIMISELGLILNESDSKITIIGIQNDAPESVKDSKAIVGDVVSAIQATKVKSMKEFLDLYEKLAIGVEFSISIEHDGKVVEAKAVKTAKSDKPQVIKTIKN